MHLTWNANIFSTFQVNSAVQEHQFGRDEVLIDNQANISARHEASRTKRQDLVQNGHCV